MLLVTEALIKVSDENENRVFSNIEDSFLTFSDVLLFFFLISQNYSRWNWIFEFPNIFFSDF